MEHDKIKHLVEEALSENKDLFLIDLKFLDENKIYVEVDGDQGIALSECIRINRYVESKLDREEEDFSLEVTSPDIANPLVVKRQYTKNIGRILVVKLSESIVEGTLKEVTDDTIMLEWTAREPKPIGKGKVTVTKNKTMLFSEIKEAKVKIIF
ncbi:MAG: ribosome assembly cofactor RimP [Flavobacteriaceae bacterium]|nr:MAG: ribosome assembly cofactor RimP [Flavobacteriaceae bacterium]